LSSCTVTGSGNIVVSGGKLDITVVPAGQYIADTVAKLSCSNNCSPSAAIESNTFGLCQLPKITAAPAADYVLGITGANTVGTILT
jgi:hypothetical protein